LLYDYNCENRYLYFTLLTHRLSASVSHCVRVLLDTCSGCSVTGDRRIDFCDGLSIHVVSCGNVRLLFMWVVRENIKCTHSRQFLAWDYIVDLATKVCRFGPKSVNFCPTPLRCSATRSTRSTFQFQIAQLRIIHVGGLI
jgi:hypothetical protein